MQPKKDDYLKAVEMQALILLLMYSTYLDLV